MPIASLLANASFDPEAVENLSAAFDDAWARGRSIAGQGPGEIAFDGS